MLSLFGFGKRRRKTTTRKTTKRRKSRMGSTKSRFGRVKSCDKKPPARLLKICKRCGIKTTAKCGGKRKYRKISILKKLCLKKLRSIKKKQMARFGAARRRSKMQEFGKRRRSRRMEEEEMEFGKRRRKSRMGRRMEEEMEFGKRRRSRRMEEEEMEFGRCRNSRFGFGAGRRVGKKSVGKAAAMKAFRQFYKRHCLRNAFGFGCGGNPPLYMSMGGEFDSTGAGGVLGPTSTGLFNTPGGSALAKASAFGARRRRSRKSMIGRRHRSRKTGLGRRRRSRKTGLGRRRRSRKSMIGRRRKSRKSMIGRRRRVRRSAIGVRRRRYARH